jgi:peptidyl-prolyl cis-trans isomerase D
MLQDIRDKFTGGIAIAILALIGVPFLFFGINYNFTSQSFAAKVDGSEIEVGLFEQSYRDQLDRNPTWAQLPDEYRVQIRQSILESMIRDRLVEMYLTKSGYQISNEQVTAAVQRVPEFQVDGVFDKETYYSVLAQNGYEPTRFEQAQRSSMREDQLRRSIGATAVVTPAEFRRYLNLIAEQRLVSLATFDLEGVAADIEVTDEMITAYYDNNPTLFLTDETVDLEFIEIRRDAVAETIEISEQALLEYYEDSQNRYLQDEQRRARHILILSGDDEEAAEATARDLLARIQGGESFEDLAREYSADGGTSAQGGDLGAMTQSQRDDELGSAIFSMDVGAVEGPVESQFGFHVVRLDEILEQGPLPLEQVRGELLSELRDLESEDMFRELERKLSDALFDATDVQDLQAIAAAAGLESQVASGITRTGGELIGSNQAAIDTVFDERVLFNGEVSDVVELDANRSAVFKVTQYHEAARQALDVVRDQISANIRTQEAQSIVSGNAAKLLSDMDAGAEFAVAAETAGATVSAPVLLSRDNSELEPAVLSQVFMATKPSQDAPVTGQVASAGGGFTVFNLEAVLPGRPQTIPQADRDAGKAQLAQQAGMSDYLAFVESLYNDADIVISRDALAAQDLLQ